MPPKYNKKKEAAAEAISRNPTAFSGEVNSATPTEPTLMDYEKMPVNDIVKCSMERNSDPITRELVLALADRVPHDPAACAEEDRRSRSIVISGLPEADLNLPPTQRQRDLDQKVDNLLDALGVECHPVQLSNGFPFKDDCEATLSP
ncbi:hypothetical protein ANCDUO_00068 [Ancylostoma duodenale]|uniref:Uncharacterized protein n=1 Tax=Ancylostoma duodenale TaxID=51022 RepID=A0A0C2HD08_9BILA|nr:hypothetical protein ANCDUO_00068 [Ancylostoma duodenale]